MLKLKKKVCDHLLSDWLTGQDMVATWKSKLREGFRNHAAVRAYYAAIPGKTAADTAWMVGRPSSVTKAAELLEDLVYNDTFDGMVSRCNQKPARCSRLSAVLLRCQANVRA